MLACNPLLRPVRVFRHWAVPSIKVYAYAPPACVDEALAEHEWIKSQVLSLVVRDDLVPRASVANVADLARELPGRESMFEQSLADDVQAFKSRAASLWAPATRRQKIWDRGKEAALRVGDNLGPPSDVTAAAGEHVTTTAFVKPKLTPSPTTAAVAAATDVRDTEMTSNSAGDSISTYPSEPPVPAYALSAMLGPPSAVEYTEEGLVDSTYGSIAGSVTASMVNSVSEPVRPHDVTADYPTTAGSAAAAGYPTTAVPVWELETPTGESDRRSAGPQYRQSRCGPECEPVSAPVPDCLDVPRLSSMPEPTAPGEPGVKPTQAMFNINRILPAWAQWRKRDGKDTGMGAGDAAPDVTGNAINAVEASVIGLTSPKGGAWSSEKSVELDVFASATVSHVLDDGMSDALIQMELLEVDGVGEASRQNSNGSLKGTFVELRPEDSWSTRMVPPGRICHICRCFDPVLHVPSMPPPTPRPTNNPTPSPHPHHTLTFPFHPPAAPSSPRYFHPKSLHRNAVRDLLASAHFPSPPHRLPPRHLQGRPGGPHLSSVP